MIEGAALFRGAVFAGGTRIIKDDASFDRVTFSGRAAFDHAKFRYASFADADFKDEAAFRHVRFEDDADFPGATFAGEAGFDESRFVADSDFSAARFEAPVRFRGVEFLGDANHYRDSATFVDATFADDADFGDATFTSGDFERTRFAGVADFDDVTVTERLDVAAATRRDAVIDMSGISLPAGQIDSVAGVFTPAGRAVLSDTVRFSYVTYTTIAYGQINLVGGLATALATAEAYLSAVFAALVVYALVERSEV